ncbi:MAG: tRNA (adenosine(37)-N6)-dimethylallyltransferase MiaA [Dehalococcoidia bacterium]|nr:tRNA (adenosine(37)-N6)-dimethylallyltransferase MiaA [Dehalococcoidia bacterium]
MKPPVSEHEKPKLLAVVGPTAAGKTALSLRLARAFNGEVVNSDSRLFYRGFDIGTAKPTTEEIGATPHHLIDFLEPEDTFGLADYLDAARKAAAEITDRGTIPVLAGGAGQYVWGLLEGWNVPRVPPNLPLRAELELEADEMGGDVVFARLKELDPVAAERIDSRNVRRVIRAIEVAEAGGNKGPSRTEEPPYDALVIGLKMGREQLYARIDARIDGMLMDGWVGEVRTVVRRGVPLSAPAMTGIGYRELAGYLAGERAYADAVHATRRATRSLARHQGNWFSADDERINWLDASDPEGATMAASALISSWLGETISN